MSADDLLRHSLSSVHRQLPPCLLLPPFLPQAAMISSPAALFFFHPSIATISHSVSAFHEEHMLVSSMLPLAFLSSYSVSSLLSTTAATSSQSLSAALSSSSSIPPSAPPSPTSFAASSSPSTSSSSPPPTPQPHKRRETGLKHMVAGSIAGMAAKTILQPLDLIKVRLQVQDGTGTNEYRGVVNAVQRVVKEEGVMGLYRGLTPNLMAAGVSWGTYFFSYNQFKDFFKRRVLSHLPPPTDPNAPPIHVQLGPLTHLSCAAASGALATTLTNPIVMVKTRLQLQGKDVLDAARQQQQSTRPYAGMVDAFGRIVREEGFFSLYRGLGPSLVLVSNGSLQFMAYEELKELCVQYVVGREEALKSHHYFLMGGLAKIFSATVTYPFAVTRSRLFARKPKPALSAPAASAAAIPTATPTAIPTTATATSPVPPPPSSKPSGKARDAKYDGMWDVMRSTWRKEGWRGFYRGLTPQLLKTAPSSAITFLIYETVVKFINKAENAKAVQQQQQQQQAGSKPATVNAAQH